jgi:signal transduction histidine kinase
MKTQMTRAVSVVARLPKPWAVGISFALAGLVGWCDYLTGFDSQVTAFYVLPVCWASWAAGRKAGLCLAVASAVSFAVASLLSRHAEVSMVILFWNTLMLLVVFTALVYSTTAATKAYQSLAHSEALLREAKEHLEETVQLRTAALRSEIAERQRQERARAEAERLLERQEKLATLGTLTAGIAHEIRNPLTSLKARLYTLEKQLQDMPKARKDTDILGAEIARLERIVRDALSFARPAEPQLEPLAADSLLAEVGSLMSPDLEKRAVRLVVEAKSGLQIRGDSGHLKQVLINLVRNGADAIAGEGAVTLRARSARVSLAGREAQGVILEVSDTGEGIPPEAERRLFDPFFTTKDGGTGLGLPIAARIVEKHGGIIQYETRPGQGTTFAVVLPQDCSTE